MASSKCFFASVRSPVESATNLAVSASSRRLEVVDHGNKVLMVAVWSSGSLLLTMAVEEIVRNRRRVAAGTL